MKASRVSSGEMAVEIALRTEKAKLLIVAADASDNSRKHYTDMAAYRGIHYAILGTRDELGRAIGKAERAAVAITDEGFANRILQLVQEERSKKTEGE